MGAERRLPADRGRQQPQGQRNAGAATDRFESERAGFFERVRSAYVARAAAEPRRMASIDASRPADLVAVDILELLRARSWIS